MSLSVHGLYRLECLARLEADRIRSANPETDLVSPAASPEAKAHVRNERLRADAFDQIGNLLSGLQADWEVLGPLVRAGYVAQRREYEAAKEAGRNHEQAEIAA